MDKGRDKRVAGEYSYVTLTLMQDKIVVNMKP